MGILPQDHEARAPQHWAVSARVFLESLHNIAFCPCLSNAVCICKYRLSWRRGASLEMEPPSRRLAVSGAVGASVALYLEQTVIVLRAISLEKKLLALYSCPSTLKRFLHWPSDTCLEGLCAKCPLRCEWPMRLFTRTLRRRIGRHDCTHTPTHARTQCLLGPS